VENTDVTMIKVSADATQVNTLLVNAIAFSPIILLGIIILVIRKAIMQRL
jgi:hypothetical protein